MKIKVLYNIFSIFLVITFLTGCGLSKNTYTPAKPTQTPINTQSPDTKSPTPSLGQLASASATPKPENTPTSTPTIIPTPTQKQSADTADTKNLSNASKGWGFKKEAGKKPAISKDTINLFSKYSAIYAGTREKTLYLTFDEGYENGYTAPILDVLKENNVPAAFFITGPYLKKQQDLVMRMVNEGHIVGNHTVNHPSMPSVTDDKKLEDEILDLDREFLALTGKSMKYIRPPKGEYSERTLALSHNLGYTSVFWSFAYVDWETDNQKGANYAYNQVMPYLHDGAILLLHAISKDNAEALSRIITDAKNLGYKFESLEEFR